ncbi:PadR family transcriptional regulator [Anoxynatronum buryatiense]|uniref:DNA-binding transcriptional regulator, PadR family n=1 Tax=Anoxynatronum buryatiense TaxID=489973 RepID=A0AA45WX52_9CLOT|nr:PadR family transcriptional regulator [Anoxynatronum buryatiense]SMP62778.1 DNA-binding transcriptional regulator, PadR family [Anoxynatronum buryatiense]
MSVMKGRNQRHLTAFILLVLAQESMHGGAIHTTLREKLPNFNTDTGAIYRCLQELEKDQAVKSSWHTEESGPARKVYEISETGLTELDEWKKDIETRLENLQFFLREYEAFTEKRHSLQRQKER